MNATKFMLCAIGATIMISAPAFEAAARTVDGTNAAGIGVSDSLIARPVFVGQRASIDNRSASTGSRVAINPQPLPPREDEE
ncbi:hypothetical protein RZS28_15830 [Methylocapsa polymorpha]|uniref:Uncharacterized protein n=1 Tax=Methylocapsa polymorpha TaxID=3080828 RepID=A0ABZ0HR63_9HYPH|nr:hypothetical protein RZS28_15830 [Methylocapsa sp. RX1]